MKKSLLFVCLVTLCSLSLFAQSGSDARPDVALKKIFTNLKANPNAYALAGGEIFGPNFEGSGFGYYLAMPFIPKDNSTVKQAQVAVYYGNSGANQVNLSIYSDSGNNAPGTLLSGPVTVTNLSNGLCCALAVANFTPVSVTAGTRYWVVADTPVSGTGSDFLGYWHFVAQGTTPQMAQCATPSGGTCNENNWGPVSGLQEYAGEVLGTIP
jgi:hypothetical protein